MADFSIVRAARRGFGGLFDARGRDDRMQFWIYCALVFAPLIVVQMVAQVVLTFPPLDMLMKAEPNDPQFAQRLFQYQMQGAAKAAFLNIGLFLLGAALLMQRMREAMGLPATATPQPACSNGYWCSTRATSARCSCATRWSAACVWTP